MERERDYLDLLTLLLVMVLGGLFGWLAKGDVAAAEHSVQFVPIPVKCDCPVDTLFTYRIDSGCVLEASHE